MASKLVLVLIATGASAFVAPSTAAAPSTVLGADLTSMPGIGKETGDKPWDPYGFATKASTDTLGWYRAAEIKHGRVAMLAFTGFVVQSMGGGMIPFGAAGARAPLSAKPFEALGQLGGAGLIQIVLTIGFIELYSETIKPHYTKGGAPGYLPIIAPSASPATPTSREQGAQERPPRDDRHDGLLRRGGDPAPCPSSRACRSEAALA
ncbi:chlorophyll A-B binding protein [Aureococcus anophagefferens]|nr:chlorophyll A-B binding protein [Aureococcus anophagefferens]